MLEAQDLKRAILEADVAAAKLEAKLLQTRKEDN